MAYYLVISAALAAEHAGYTSGPNTFVTTKTADGRTVCAHLSLFEFPELFIGRRITPVELTETDFPPVPTLTPTP